MPSRDQKPSRNVCGNSLCVSRSHPRPLFLRLIPRHASRLRQLCFHEGRVVLLRYLDAAVSEKQGNLIDGHTRQQ